MWYSLFQTQWDICDQRNHMSFSFEFGNSCVKEYVGEMDLDCMYSIRSLVFQNLHLIYTTPVVARVTGTLKSGFDLY